MEVSPVENAALRTSAKNALGDTPVAANAPANTRSLATVGEAASSSSSSSNGSSNSSSSINKSKNCLSPPRPRQQRASCKPSPARSAAAVILATLLGGQEQPVDTQAGEVRLEGKAASASAARSSTFDASSDGENCGIKHQHCSLSVAGTRSEENQTLGARPWSQVADPTAEEGRASEVFTLSDASHLSLGGGSESPAPSRSQEASAKRRRPVRDSPTREAGPGTPASAHAIRRSPRRRWPCLRSDDTQDDQPPVRAAAPERQGGRAEREGQVEEKELARERRGCHEEMSHAEGRHKYVTSGNEGMVGGLLFSPEGLAASACLSDEGGYSNYCRKDKSLGLLCGRFVEVYGRSQHFRAKVAGATAGRRTVDDGGVVGGEGMIELDRAAGELGVARRRIYDVINILESVCVVTRARKNTYRWHGKSNLLVTLRQLQRTAALVFPQEVLKNDMTECLQGTKLPGNAVGSLGGPRADGTKEKSLGGLCRRFVQLFLVGNDVVSVAAAAEKLSDPADVACGTVVFKTRARRLYDIANALAALGLVRKVRSPDSCKPNFRWIGIPVRDLPVLETAQLEQHEPARKGDDKRAVPGNMTPSAPTLHVGTATGSCRSGADQRFGKESSEALEQGGRMIATNSRDGHDARIARSEAAGASSRNADALDTGEASTPTVVAASCVDLEAGLGSARSGYQWPERDTSCRTFSPRRWVSPAETPDTTPLDGSGDPLYDTGCISSDIMSDQGSPVDPRKVMRELSEAGSCETGINGISGGRRTRKRTRIPPRCQSWLTERGEAWKASSVSPQGALQSALSGSGPAGIAHAQSPPTSDAPCIPDDAKRPKSAGLSYTSLKVTASPIAKRSRVARVSESPRAYYRAGVGWVGQYDTPASENHRAPCSSELGDSLAVHDSDDGLGGDGNETLTERWVDGETNDAVAVTPRDDSLVLPNPDLLRRRLDKYMEVYTQQWQIWQEGGSPELPQPPLPMHTLQRHSYSSLTPSPECPLESVTSQHQLRELNRPAKQGFVEHERWPYERAADGVRSARAKH